MRPVPGLEEAARRDLEALLEPLRGYRLYLFGSRANGAWRPRSDIDILVEGDAPIPLGLLSRIETEIAESGLPVSVDIVDAGRASPEFVAILREGGGLLPLEF